MHMYLFSLCKVESSSPYKYPKVKYRPTESKKDINIATSKFHRQIFLKSAIFVGIRRSDTLVFTGVILSNITLYTENRLMTKPTKWHVRPAKTLISLGIRPVWLESSLCAHVRPAKTLISLGIRPVWSESSLCAEWVANHTRKPCETIERYSRKNPNKIILRLKTWHASKSQRKMRSSNSVNDCVYFYVFKESFKIVNFFKA